MHTGIGEKCVSGRGLSKINDYILFVLKNVKFHKKKQIKERFKKQHSR